MGGLFLKENKRIIKDQNNEERNTKQIEKCKTSKKKVPGKKTEKTLMWANALI